jgi:diacylglycerol kinase
MNSAIEKYIDCITTAFKTDVKDVKDVATVAVLVAAIISLIIAALIYSHKIFTI